MRDAELLDTTSAAGLAGQGWAGLLTPEDLYLSERWLVVAERTAGCPMRYLLLRDGETAHAGLATAFADSTAPWVRGRPDTLLQFSAEAGRPGAAEIIAALPASPAESLLPTLLCGGRHMARSRVLRGPLAGRRSVEALVVRAEEIAAAQGAASVAYPFVAEDDALLNDVLGSRGYLRHESGRHSTLRIGFSDFDEYLAQFSASRRRRILAERRKIRAADVRMRIEPLSPGVIPRLGELEEQLMAKYGVRWKAAQTEQVLREMLDVFGEDALTVLALADGEIRGFVTLLRFHDDWYARQSGFDYAYQSRCKLALYFETVYYVPAEAAVQSGIGAIHYGLGSEEAKRSRGCRAETQYGYILPLTPLARPPAIMKMSGD